MSEQTALASLKRPVECKFGKIRANSPVRSLPNSEFNGRLVVTVDFDFTPGDSGERAMRSVIGTLKKIDSITKREYNEQSQRFEIKLVFIKGVQVATAAKTTVDFMKFTSERFNHPAFGKTRSRQERRAGRCAPNNPFTKTPVTRGIWG